VITILYTPGVYTGVPQDMGVHPRGVQRVNSKERFIMEKDKKPVANPSVVLREEFDDWALLFDPDTSDIFTLDPVAVYIWKHLDGSRTPGDITAKLRQECNDMPEDADRYVVDFIADLKERGLVGYELQNG